MRRDTRRIVATDAEGNELRVGDNVKEVDGEVCTFLGTMNASHFSGWLVFKFIATPRNCSTHPPGHFRFPP